MKKIKRFTIAFAILVLVLVVAIRIMLPRIAPSIASDGLSQQMKTNVQVSGMNLGILQGKIGLDHFSIEQPAAFSNAPSLLTISNPRIQINISKLFRSNILIKGIQVDSLTLHIIRNADGVLNLQELMPPAKEKEEEEEKEQNSEKSKLVATLEQILVSDVTISYTDYTTTPPIALVVTNLQLQAQNLIYNPSRISEPLNMPGKLQLTAELLQSGYPDGYLGLISAIGVIQTNIPPVNAAVRVVGFDLRSLRGLIPPGIATTLGGSNLDIITDAAAAKNYLAVASKVQTAKNTLRLDVGGTPQKPIFDKSTALFNVITRPTAFVTGTVSGVTDAGLAAGQSVVATAERAGGGVLSGIMNIGKGAARTVKGVTKGDVRGIGEGVRDMTIGTVTGAVNTVTSTAREVGIGLENTVSAASGKAQTDKWEGENAVRWEKAWQNAQNFVDTAPFPGTGKSKPPQN